MSIGERIKKIRHSYGYTQQSVADKLNLKRQTIAAYEIGTVTPSDRTITDICREFNVNEAWLRTGEGEMFRKQSRENELAAYMNNLLQSEPDDIRLRFATAVSHLSTQQLEILESIALQLADDLRVTESQTSTESTQNQLPELVAAHAAEPDDSDIEAAARAEAEEYYRQILLEKRAAMSEASCELKIG